MRDVFIVSSVRTAVGKAGRGTLATTSPVDLGSAALHGAVDQVDGLSIDNIEDLIVGCATPESEQGLNVAMTIGQRAGLGDRITGVTVNRLCSSGLQAIAMAHQSIAFGQAEVIGAGGVESMSQVAMGGNHFMANEGLMEEFPEAYMNMGNTAEQVVERYNVDRTRMDQFALDSHAKALDAIAAGRFEDEIIPMNVAINLFDGGRVKTIETEFKVDEGPRAGSTLEKLATLKSPFKAGGQVTAATSSQVSDGGAMTVLMSGERLKETGAQPFAKLLGFAVAPVEAALMGVGPINAVPRVLKQVGLELSDIGLIELNEAFASQSIAVIDALGLNPEIVNVNGGALALGHPLGCTGAKLTATLLHEMKRRGVRYGLCTMCVGGGMGAAGIFENLQI